MGNCGVIIGKPIRNLGVKIDARQPSYLVVSKNRMLRLSVQGPSLSDGPFFFALVLRLENIAAQIAVTHDLVKLILNEGRVDP
jgi:hypothetical protein